MFLLRAVFWLSIVVLLIPGDPAGGREAPSVSAIDAILAARGAIADLSGMCTRQPEVCDHGGAALSAFGAKARYSATYLYDAFERQPAETSATATEAPAAPVTLPRPVAPRA